MSNRPVSPVMCAIFAITGIHACFLVAAFRALLWEGLKQALIVEGIGFGVSFLLFTIPLGVWLLNDRRQDNFTAS